MSTRIVTLTTTSAEGYTKVEGYDATDVESVTVNGYRAFIDSPSDCIWDNARHEAWLMLNSKDSKYIGTGTWNAVGRGLRDSRIKGVVYTMNWKALESALNTYTTTSTDTTAGTAGNPLLYVLDYMHSIGKKVILRIWWKSYTGYTAIPNPATVAVPTYILNDPTYGGSSAGAYGVKSVNTGGSPVGWGGRYQ